MAVTVVEAGEDERGVVYEIGLSTAADAAQAQLIGDDPEGLLWQLGKVSWHKTVNVTVSFTNAGGAAMAVASGNGVLAGWVAPPGQRQNRGVGNPADHWAPLHGEHGESDGAALHRQAAQGRPRGRRHAGLVTWVRSTPPSAPLAAAPSTSAPSARVPSRALAW